MKHLIVYCSTHGTTEKAAMMLKEFIYGDVELVNLKESEPQLLDYDAIIIGGSIHIGNVQSKIKQFIKINRGQLKTKKIGLFLCCMREGVEAQEQFDLAFPEDLRETAIASGIFGGEFLVSKMNFIERQIVKAVSSTTQDTFALDEKVIRKFSDAFNLSETA